MAVPMQSTLFKSVVEPIINKVFDGIFKQRTPEWSQFATQITGTPRGYHEEPVLYGFGAAPEVPDGQPVTYQQGGTNFIKRYTYAVYGLAFAITKVLAEDGDHIRIGKTYGEHLAQSLIETKELLIANIFNRAFNGAYPGGDGVSFVNAAHVAPGGLTYSNQLTTAAALSQTSLEQMLIQIRSAFDDTGRKIQLEPRKIICSPSNVMQAEVLLKSVLRTGTTNNDVNPIKSLALLKGGQANLSRLTSNTAWGVLTDAPHGVQLVMRRPLQRSGEGDFETDSARFKGMERYAAGWTQPRAMYATAGQ